MVYRNGIILVILLFGISNVFGQETTWCNKAILDVVKKNIYQTKCDTFIDPKVNDYLNKMISKYPFFNIETQNGIINKIEFENSFGLNEYCLGKNLFKNKNKYWFILKDYYKEILKSDTCF